MGIEARDAHARLDHELARAGRGAPVDALREAQRCRPLRLRLAAHLELIVEPRGRAVLDLEADHREQHPLLALQPLLREAARAQPLGARALEEAQVVGVVDDATGIGVLPVDARRPAEAAHRGSSNSGRVAAARSGGFRPKC